MSKQLYKSKLTYDHIHLTGMSKMKVKLAAQVNKLAVNKFIFECIIAFSGIIASWVKGKRMPYKTSIYDVGLFCPFSLICG